MAGTQIQWRLCLLATVLMSFRAVCGQAVFAHFMVTNTQNYSTADWNDDISKAQAAHIDAFALNMATGDPANTPGLQAGFAAANSLGFKLFFSFDYGGNGPWAMADVISLVNQYGSNGAYYHYKGKPFVSTFEGPGNSDDWKTIKSKTGCFFIPDWSSIGAQAAAAKGVADGLFSWAAWPWGNTNMNTYVDASYRQYLNGLPYMMSVSPWFYTNLPGYNKNWLWRGDDLWYDRWQEVLVLKPEFVEIVTWNDYGESHYIGPVRSNAYAAFSIGQGPFNYADGMPHDGWRQFLPFLIDTYKTGKATVTKEGIVGWYRRSPASACADGGTTGNTASQLQMEFAPSDVVQDRVFFSALLGSSASVSVSIGGSTQQATWSSIPDGGIGIYHGSVPFNGNTGSVVVTLKRSGSTVAQFTGASITTSCTNGLNNYNAWVGSASASASISATPKLSLSQQGCINGTAAAWSETDAFNTMCSFTCAYDYCPPSACLCTALGAPRTKPKATGVQGYPLDGGDPNFLGLCAFACNYGTCPPNVCQTTNSKPNLVSPPISPFLPPAVTGGSGSGQWAGLCSYSCGYGHCPRALCTVSSTGALNAPVAPFFDREGVSTAGPDSGLCNFACQRPDYCPNPCYVRASRGFEPITWTAFGDSYSAGHGAGLWISTSFDGRDNPCARGSFSYPQLYTNERGPGYPPGTYNGVWQDFWSCTGNKLNDLATQIDNFGSQTFPSRRVDAAFLSISGNDLNFAEVVSTCVYPKARATGPSYQQACTDSLTKARDLIEGDAVWNTYVNRVQAMFARILRPDDGQLFITGYPQFFADDGYDGDRCDSQYFLELSVIGYKLPMLWSNRRSMNAAVREVNQFIRSKVIAVVVNNNPQLAGRIQFIDVDSFAQGHRFCEQRNNDDPRGLQPNSDVFIYDFLSELDETREWQNTDDAVWDGVWDDYTDLPDNTTVSEAGEPSYTFRGYRDRFQQTSSFHPKADLHDRTAVAIRRSTLQLATADSRVVNGPGQICTGYGSGDGNDQCISFGADCAGVRPVDNSVPLIVCANGTALSGAFGPTGNQ